MILPWIYVLLSRGEFFKHGDLLLGTISGSSTAVLADILPMTKLNQLAAVFVHNNLTNGIDSTFSVPASDFKFMSYLNCESSTELAYLEKLLSNTSISSITITKWNDSLPETSIMDHFSMYCTNEFAARISITSHLYVLRNSNIYEIYCRFDRQLIVHKLENGQGESFLSSRKNFQMNTLIAAHTKEWSGQFSSSSVIEMGGNISLTYQYLGYMQDFLNFTVEVQSNDNWGKMANNIRFQDADIGISASVIHSNAMEHFKFLMPPTYIDKVTIHFLPVQGEASTILVHIKSFQPKIWLAIFVILLMITICYSVTSWPLNLSEPVWLILCCFCQQGFSIGKPNYVRIMTFTCSLFCIIIYAMYSGSLISAMSTQSNLLNSITQLIDSGYRFGIHNSSDTYYTSVVFKNDSYDSITTKAGDATSRNILANLHSSRQLKYPCLKLGIQTALSAEKYALITEMSMSSIVGEFQQQKENLNTRCWPLHQFPIPNYSVQQTYITRKDSPLVKYFNLARFTMKERGISDAIMKRRSNYIRGLKPNCEILSEGERPFTLRDVAVPLFIMSFGILFSLITLGAEIIYKEKDGLFIAHSDSTD